MHSPGPPLVQLGSCMHPTKKQPQHLAVGNPHALTRPPTCAAKLLHATMFCALLREHQTNCSVWEMGCKGKPQRVCRSGAGDGDRRWLLCAPDQPYDLQMNCEGRTQGVTARYFDLCTRSGRICFRPEGLTHNIGLLPHSSGAPQSPTCPHLKHTCLHEQVPHCPSGLSA